VRNAEPHGPDRWRHVTVGGRCNNNCRFCVANTEWQERPLSELIGEVGAAVQRRSHGLHFTHGELTLRSDLPRFLRVLRNSRLSWSLATNGRYFANERNVTAFRNAGLVATLVSLHGFAPTHNETTGDDSFDQAIAGIQNLHRAKVQVRISTVTTARVIEETHPREFARFIASLKASTLVINPPEIPASLAHLQGELVPALEPLLEWLGLLTSELASSKVSVETRGLPHCAMPNGVVTIPETPSRVQARPCRTCRKQEQCPGYDQQRWIPAEVDFLRPDSPTSPGHLEFRPGRSLQPFVLSDCPYRSGERRFPCGHDGIIKPETDGSPRIWRVDVDDLVPAVLRHAKLVYGQIWWASADEQPVPLYLADECANCPSLPQCPGFYSSRDTVSLPVTESPNRAAFDLTSIVDEAWDGAAEINEAVREVWLIDDDTAKPRRPYPVDPVRLTRALRRNRVVPLSYRIPKAEDRSLFSMHVVHEEQTSDPFITRHHEGVSLQVTEACMCRCVMCNIVGYFKVPPMSVQNVFSTLEQCGLLGIRLADLFGGEVTLRKDLFQLLDHVRWLGMESMFITTGYYVTTAFARKLVDSGVTRVVVSIDGSRAEIHDSIRQTNGIFTRAVRALKALVAEPSIETFASTVILSENLHDLPALVKLTGRLGVPKHEFFLPISGPISSTTPRWPSADEMSEFFESILPAMRKTARKAGVTIDFRPELRQWEIPQEETIAMVSQGQYNIHARDPESRCNAPGFNFFITVNGNVYPCDMPAIISRTSSLGNLADATLLDIATSSEMREFATKAGHYDACRMCVGRYEAVRRDQNRD
jgi:radical SAM protein with 4Fe4S-binding SPASM domain